MPSNDFWQAYLTAVSIGLPILAILGVYFILHIPWKPGGWYFMTRRNLPPQYPRNALFRAGQRLFVLKLRVGRLIIAKEFIPKWEETTGFLSPLSTNTSRFTLRKRNARIGWRRFASN